MGRIRSTEMGIKREKLCGKTLTAWRKRMGGYSMREAATIIGCSRETWAKYEKEPNARIPRYIGLAMAALALGINPFESDKTKAINAKAE
jgi:predicted transcriptional regulator